MEIIATKIPDVKLIKPKKHGDQRGFFSEVYNKAVFEKADLHLHFAQDNHAFSAEKGTVRGLHFQVEPHGQDKLVRVTRGSILDVAVDVRKGSPTYGQHVAEILSAENWHQLLVPIGFAHGYCTMEPDTEVLYKVTNYYSPEHDRGLIWNDNEIGIKWPVKESEAILSAKDQAQPPLAQLGEVFDYNTMFMRGTLTASNYTTQVFGSKNAGPASSTVNVHVDRERE